ncbi:MAG TPA: 2-amino-4-hydroxy-6-hydroxymethyldihydropteridine diphosphokinase [Alphaproteobacteria bacterium]
MILVAIGANLPGPAGSPRAQCEAALALLEEAGIAVTRRSRWFESAPMPPSAQPWFVNGVVALRTTLGPVPLLAELHRIEAALGRMRTVPNAARTIDLDLLDYDGIVRPGPEPPILPHPRMHERRFVLLPLADIAADWRHPVTGRTVAELAAEAPPEDIARPLAASQMDD